MGVRERVKRSEIEGMERKGGGKLKGRGNRD